MLTALTVIGLCSVITAAQGGDVELLYQDCSSCCEGSSHTSCYVIVDQQSVSCGRGLNICDMEPPIE